MSVMANDDLHRAVRNALLCALAKEGARYIPVAVSNRHLHLCRADVERLFGAGHYLTPMRPLSQPGQYACEETVVLKGPKSSLAKVRVLGPERPESQAEISFTDSFTLGVKPVVRMSGKLSSSPGVTLVGPRGEAALASGVIVAARHVHFSPEQAAAFGIRDNDEIKLYKGGERAMLFERVVARVHKDFDLEAHFDSDEANAAGIRNGDLLEIRI